MLQELRVHVLYAEISGEALFLLHDTTRLDVRVEVFAPEGTKFRWSPSVCLMVVTSFVCVLRLLSTHKLITLDFHLQSESQSIDQPPSTC